MKRLLSLVLLFTGIVAFAQTAEDKTDIISNPTSTLNYGDYSFTGSASGTTYDFHQCYGNYAKAGGNGCNYQLTQTKKSYITNTESKGVIKQISVNIISGQMKVYADNEPYTSYGSTAPHGDRIAVETTTGTKTITFEKDYKYFYIAANTSTAFKINDVEFTWSVGGGDAPAKQKSGICWGAETYDYAIGESSVADLPALTNPNSLPVSYASSDETVAEIAADGTITAKAAGQTVITATFAGDDTYNKAEVSCTLTVTDPNAPIPGTVEHTITTSLFPNLTGSQYKADSYTADGVTYNVLCIANSTKGIQLNNNGRTSGLYISANINGYMLKEIKVEYVSGVPLDFYGSQTAYTAISTTGTAIGAVSASTTLDCGSKYRYVSMTPAKSNATYVKSMTFVWVKPDENFVAPPALTPSADFAKSIEVTITSAADESIRYTTDPAATLAAATDGEPYEGPLTFTETTTIRAIAYKIADPAKVSEEVSATYTQMQKAASLAAIPDMPATASGSSEPFLVAFNAVVTYASGRYVYVYVPSVGRAASDTDYMMIYVSADQTVKPGDVIAGNWVAQVKNYGEQPELVPADEDAKIVFTSESEGAEYPVYATQTNDAFAEVPVYAPVKMTGVNFKGDYVPNGSTKVAEGNLPKQTETIAFRNTFNLALPENPDNYPYYAIEGLKTIYNGTPQVAITKIERAPIVTGVDDVITDNTDAPVEYYNLQGIRVANPENGIYIRRQGNKVTKVFVK